MVIHLAANVVNMTILSFLSVFDYKNKKIPVQTVVVYITAGFIYSVCMHEAWSAVVSLIPGLCFIVFSFVSKEKVGLGDGMTLVGMGFWDSGFIFYKEFLDGVLLLCLFSCLVISVNKLKGKRVDSSVEIPMIPFLFLGVLGERLFG